MSEMPIRDEKPDVVGRRTVGFGQSTPDFEDWGGLGPSRPYVSRYPIRKPGARAAWYRKQVPVGVKSQWFFYGAASMLVGQIAYIFFWVTLKHFGIV